MTDLNQQQPGNLDWPPSTNAHTRGHLPSSAEKTPIGFLPSKSGQVGKGLKANSKEETKHDVDYGGPEVHRSNLSPQAHSTRVKNNRDERLDNGVVEPSERPRGRPTTEDYPNMHETHIDQHAALPTTQPATGSPMMPSPPMGIAVPTMQLGPVSLNGSNRDEKSGQNDGDTPTSDTAPEFDSTKANQKLSANAAVFQPSQKKVEAPAWDYSSAKGSRSKGSNDSRDGQRYGISSSGSRHAKGPEDRTLQKLNLLYPSGPTPDTTQYLSRRGPKAPRYEYLSSANTWLPGQYHQFDWKEFVYTLGAPIHMGMNGHIHHCVRQQRGPDGAFIPRKKNVAAKVVPNTPAFEREIIILRALQQDCNNIIKLKDVVEQPTCLISVMELAQTDVHQFFAGRSAKQHGWRLDKTATREYFARMVVNDVVHGLKQMHDRRYLHCDLKAQNILMFIWRSSRKGGSYVQAKLTDFGHSWKGQVRMAERLFPNGMARVGTAGHVAPELFVEGSACGPKIDIWSLGIVMFSMLVPGHLPFGEYSNVASLRTIYDSVNDPEIAFDDSSPWTVLFNSCSPEARDLILWMTRLDPGERPDEDQILAHPWFHISRGIKDTTGYRGKLQYWNSMSHYSGAYE